VDNGRIGDGELRCHVGTGRNSAYVDFIRGNEVRAQVCQDFFIYFEIKRGGDFSLYLETRGKGVKDKG